MNNANYEIAAVHGRFQPLHNDHLNYILEAKKRCDFLWIGITQFNVSSLIATPNDPHRQVPTNNPLTYFERIEIINNALLDSGIKFNEFSCIPFPIETPDYILNFIPNTIPMFTTICDKWNIHKIRLLKEKGFRVIVLYRTRIKKFEGIIIRNQIIKGDEKWHESVPVATKNAIYKYNIQERLINLGTQSS